MTADEDIEELFIEPGPDLSMISWIFSRCLNIR